MEKDDTFGNAFSRLRAFNARANDLPRKGFVVLCVLFCLLLLGKAFPYIAPFVVAFVLSALMEPLVRLLSSEKRRFRIPRKLAALLCMVVLVAVLSLVVVLVSSRALVELKALLAKVPSTAVGLVNNVNGWLDEAFLWLDSRVGFIDDATIASIKDGVRQFSGTIVDQATSLAPMVARGAWVTATSVPQVVLFLVLMLLGTYYMASDRERIIAYFRRTLPRHARNLLGQMKTGMLRAVFGQVRAQVYLTIMMFFELLLGFSIMRVQYALLLALVISVMDALPVIGSGLFLIPWSIFGFVTGDMFIGVGMLLLYGVTLVVRQLVEPRVVGAQLGVYPLATMMSMYAGFVFFGFFGMLAGPVTFLLCRVAVYAICGAPEEVRDLLEKKPRPRVVYIPKKK